MQVETIFLGGKRISIRTSMLEEKATACNMLCCYADELKAGFFPYVQQVGAAAFCTPLALHGLQCVFAWPAGHFSKVQRVSTFPGTTRGKKHSAILSMLMSQSCRSWLLCF